MTGRHKKQEHNRFHLRILRLIEVEGEGRLGIIGSLALGVLLIVATYFMR